MNLLGSKWFIPAVSVIVGLILGALIFSMFRKNQEAPSALQNAQDIRMEQYRVDSAKFMRVIVALRFEKEKLDCTLFYKELNYQRLWKQHYANEKNRVTNLTPDSTCLFFAEFTEHPPN